MMAQIAIMKKQEMDPIDGRTLLKYGLLAGVIALYVAVIGMITTFSKRELIAGILTLGQVLLISPPLGMAFYVAQKLSREGK